MAALWDSVWISSTEHEVILRSLSSTGQQLGIGKADYSIGECEVFFCAAVARPRAWKEKEGGELAGSYDGDS